MNYIIRIISVAIASAVITLTSGCSSTSLLSGEAYKQYTKNLVLSDGAIGSLVALDKKPLSVKSGSVDEMQLTLSRLSPEQQKSVVKSFIGVSDGLCDIYLSEIIGSSKEIKSGLGLLGLGLSTAGGVATPVDSSNLLSVLTAGVIGVEPILDRTLLQDHDAATIYDAVMLSRTKQRLYLLALLDKGHDTGSVLAEMNDYHNRCGVTNGVTTLKDAIKEAEDSAPEKANVAAEKVLNKNANP